MNMNRDEAARALADIDAAGRRSTRLQYYRNTAPHLMLWGAIWLVANTLSDLAPALAGKSWLTLTLIGAALSAWLGSRRRAAAHSRDTPSDGQGARWGLGFAVIVAFFIATLAILAPLSPRQQDAYISIVWTFLYALAGVWLGWRLFAIGLAASLLIVLGYFFVETHFFLYMGVVSGGALMAGGWWLRRV